MLDELRDRVTSFLSQNQVCVISTNGSLGAWAVLAQYESAGLTLNCRLPRWSDVVYYLEQEPNIMVLILDAASEKIRWLQYRGVARLTDSSDEFYVAVQVTPKRVDLVDESRGWGVRETLDV